MKIYAVYEGNQFEGGNVRNPLYKSKQDARSDAIQLVKELNKWEGDEDYMYTEKEPDTWRLNYDYICIMEYELI